MGFVVFNKGVFVDFWLNSRSDYSWVERTVSSKGWNPNEIEVHDHDYQRTPETIVSFSEERALEILVMVDGVLTVDQTIESDLFYAKGLLTSGMSAGDKAALKAQMIAEFPLQD